MAEEEVGDGTAASLPVGTGGPLPARGVDVLLGSGIAVAASDVLRALWAPPVFSPFLE